MTAIMGLSIRRLDRSKSRAKLPDSLACSRDETKPFTKGVSVGKVPFKLAPVQKARSPAPFSSITRTSGLSRALTKTQLNSAKSAGESAFHELGRASCRERVLKYV